MPKLSQIRASLAEGATEEGCLRVGRAAAKRQLGLGDAQITSIELVRKSIDARKKNDVHFILSFLVNEEPAAFELPRAACTDGPRPVVVGAGCAGLFAALVLAKAGLRPLLLERGDDAERRSAAIEGFVRTRELDLESNIQFGLGGAGTFSDGKLNTGTKSPSHRFILQEFVKAGAPRDVLWEAKPHIGSDNLPTVVTNIVRQIEALGGNVCFRTKLVGIRRGDGGAVCGVRVEAEAADAGALRALREAAGECAFKDEGAARSFDIPCNHVILATGHSARDVFELLQCEDVALARKTFAMGVRIEHLQRDVDRAQYGRVAGHPALGAAPYKLVAHLPNGRNVFSFCMCPGGEVVAAASEAGGVCVNGASKSARAGKNANAALLVNVNPEDLPGTDPLEGVRLQRRCEQAAFKAGGGNYSAPAQLVGDFLAGRPSAQGVRVKPTYPLGVAWGSLDGLLPQHIVESLRLGIPVLGKKFSPYRSEDAVLTGVETRSSSPVQVSRGAGLQSVNTPGLYPCGEGAGYAGGIMSAAADGIRVATALVEALG